MSRARIEGQLRQFFEEDGEHVVAVYLFGSVARQEHRPDSDVDVAVLLEQTPPAILEGLPLDWEAQIESLLGRPARIVVLNGAAPDLIRRVLRDGRLLVDRDPSQRIRFEVQARNEYFDLEPHLRRYRGQS